MSFESRRQSRALSAQNAKPLPEAKFVRDGHVVRNADGNVEFTGLVKVAGQDVASISAAKRWVRARRFKQFELRKAA